MIGWANLFCLSRFCTYIWRRPSGWVLMFLSVLM